MQRIVYFTRLSTRRLSTNPIVHQKKIDDSYTTYIGSFALAGAIVCGLYGSYDASNREKKISKKITYGLSEGVLCGSLGFMFAGAFAVFLPIFTILGIPIAINVALSSYDDKKPIEN